MSRLGRGIGAGTGDRMHGTPQGWTAMLDCEKQVRAQKLEVRAGNVAGFGDGAGDLGCGVKEEGR